MALRSPQDETGTEGDESVLVLVLVRGFEVALAEAGTGRFEVDVFFKSVQ